MKHRKMKLPNGFGSIIFLGNNRRNPYGALKTTGWDENGRQIKKYIGYADTYNNAYKLLMEYNNTPFDLTLKNATLDYVFNIVEPILKDEYLNGTMSKSNYKNMISVYNNHLKKLEKVKLMDLKKKQVQQIIDNSNLKHTGRGYIKNIFKRLIDYAIDELELPIDVKLTNLNVGKKEKSTKHYPFTIEEINTIKNCFKNDLTAKLFMVLIYTGLRTGELVNIETKNVYLDKNYMIGGSKTEAGRNRIIPIHSEIKRIIEELYDEKNQYLVMNPNSNTKMSYDAFQKKFNDLMKRLNFNHSPYDTRHTFATYCEKCNISLTNIKRIMGHSLSNDVTNDVYIHVDINILIKEIEKLHY